MAEDPRYHAPMPDSQLPEHPHPRAHLALLALLAAALLFGLWGVWTVVGARGGEAATVGSELDGLRQQVATLARSDQVSREANQDLQGTLAERDEEVSALRADVAFYERLVGSTSQRRGLTVHGLRLQPQGEGAWHFTATLTQTLNRAAVSRGRLTLAVEGSRNGSLERLEWSDLRPQDDAMGAEYSFKYFQQLEGDILLPEGFTPLRVHVRLAPVGAPAVDGSFPWADAAGDVAPRSSPDA
ncbi:hypothetical protein H6X63_01750 [Luteimonas sp. MC1825]|nr:hypothetical protein [Luteimonas sp. MC1825]QOC88565.1 hypothetical protein IDM46_02050 [Luteimonas sp. MC1825]